VLYDYAQFPCNKKTKGKCREFINATWENYQEDFSVVGIEKETKEALTKIVLYNVHSRQGLQATVNTNPAVAYLSLSFCVLQQI